MPAVDYATEYGNFNTQAYAIAGMMGPAYVAKAFGMSVVQTEQFSDSSNTIRVPISGSLVAEIVAESTPYVFSASGELTDTYVACTAEKSVVSSRVSVESLRFGGPTANLERIANEHGLAHGRLFDSKLKALFPSLSQSVTATTNLEKNNLLDARYYVESGTDGNESGSMVGVFDHKGVTEIRKQLTDITATAFTNMELLSLVGLSIPGATPVGEFAGIQVYQTSGLTVSGGDDIGAVFDPAQCFFAGVDVANGFNVRVHDPRADNGITYEVLSWTFFKVVEWRDAAGCKVGSDT